MTQDLLSSVEEFRQKLSVDPKEEEPIGEIEVAEYLIFVLGLDTYIRHIEEATGEEDPTDPVIDAGIRLLKILDNQLDRIQTQLNEHLPSDTHRNMLARALRYRPTVGGVGQQVLLLRTLLNIGGPKTVRGIFSGRKLQRQLQLAINAAEMDDGDAAMDQFAAMPLKNPRIRKWMDWAAASAQPLGGPPGEVPVPADAPPAPVPVEQAAQEGMDRVPELMKKGVEVLGSGAMEEVQAAAAAQTAALQEVETAAATAARNAMEQAGEPDEPPTRSEVAGIATAAAVAVSSDPSNPQNIPPTLASVANDPEQLAAALTDGQVLVAAGAGSGKSRTLIARVNYLLQTRGVQPERVLVTSFNRDAADKLQYKIGSAVGDDAADRMQIGTMHGLFASYIRRFGTPEEKEAIGKGPENPGGFVGGGGSVARTANQVFRDCYLPPGLTKEEEEEFVPKAKDMMRYKTIWAGNRITPQEARAKAAGDPELERASLWYEIYEGLKGGIPGWRPTCRSRNFERFMVTQRKVSPNKPEGIRLADFDDQIAMFESILARDPAARKMVQSELDHILIDESQDLNEVQASVIRMMSEHILDPDGNMTNGQDGGPRSLWLVGDDKQAIYEFRGARPDQFIERHEDPKWQTRSIRTNYRCPPEVVELANRVIANNEGQIPMEANPSPGKARGKSSIRVEVPQTVAEAAYLMAVEIKRRMETEGLEPRDFAILARTNAEINALEQAFLLLEVPYACNGTASFLGAPETKAMLGYMQLALGDDPQKMQRAFESIITVPNRFFIKGGAKKASEMIQSAFRVYAMRNRLDIKSLNPFDVLQDPEFLHNLVVKFMNFDPDNPSPRLSDRQIYGLTKGFEEKLALLEEMVSELLALREKASEEGAQTKDLFDQILMMKGVKYEKGEQVEVTFRDALAADLRDATGDDDDSDEEDEEEDEGDDTQKLLRGLGNIGFLYQLAQSDPNDPADQIDDPATPLGFRTKIERILTRVRGGDLRTDLKQFKRDQRKKPISKREERPAAVYLGTAHSTKGLQFPNTYVLMPRGKFPMERKGDKTLTPEEKQSRLEQERRLAYVALTRTEGDLTIVCPQIVAGRRAGISPFVGEAELNVGENVQPPEADRPLESNVPKEASYEYAFDPAAEAHLWQLSVGGEVDDA